MSITSKISAAVAAAAIGLLALGAVASTTETAPPSSTTMLADGPWGDPAATADDGPWG